MISMSTRNVQKGNRLSFLFATVILILNLCEVKGISLISDPSNPCHPKYASQTKTTNECVCLSRNCVGPQCQSSQGFVWYNYVKCPTCECIAPKKTTPKEILDSPSQNRNEQGKNEEKDVNVDIKKIELNKQHSDTENVNTVKSTEISNEELETWSEWFLDNTNIIFAFFVGSCVSIIIALYLFMSVFKSNDVLSASKTDEICKVTTASAESSNKSQTSKSIANAVELKESKKS